MIAGDLFELVQIHGPSGFETRVAEKLQMEMQACLDEVYLDKMGNVIGKKEGERDDKILMIMSHMDEVSLVVRNVDDFVWFERVGWINEKVLMGTPVTILGSDKDVDGVICSVSAHFADAATNSELWIDVGDRQRHVSVGDPVVFSANARWLNDDKTILSSKAVDNRVGCAVLLDIARNLSTIKPKSTVYLIGSVQEEVGSFGARYIASKIKADYLIAIDTAFARDAIADRGKSIELGTGPVLRRFQMAQPSGSLYPAAILFSSRYLDSLIISASKKLNLPLNMDVYTQTFTDSTLFSNFNPEVECSTIMIPRRYSHSPNEVVDVTNAESCSRILHQVILDLE